MSGSVTPSTSRNEGWVPLRAAASQLGLTTRALKARLQRLERIGERALWRTGARGPYLADLTALGTCRADSVRLLGIGAADLPTDPPTLSEPLPAPHADGARLERIEHVVLSLSERLDHVAAMLALGGDDLEEAADDA